MTDGKREAISGNYITDNENKPRYFSFFKIRLFGCTRSCRRDL